MRRQLGLSPSERIEQCQKKGPMLDLVLRNGTVVDGSGGPAYRADVGVVADTIVAIGEGLAMGGVDFDATGLTVSPGFVDPHSHSDFTVHANRNAESTIRQGVTTEIVGNCGLGSAPVTQRSAPTVEARLRMYGYEGPVTWRSFDDYLREVEGQGISQNLAFFVGHSALREAAGLTGPAKPDDPAVRMMGDMLREAMEAGALGLSSGLEYRAGRFADTNELGYLNAIVGTFQGYYASHIRNRDSAILAAIDEFIEVVRVGNTAGQISHLNVRHDTNAPAGAWDQAVEAMARARGAGLDIEADTTPFNQGLGMMAGILPEWLLRDGYAVAAARLADQNTRARVRADCDRYWRFIAKGQWERVRLLASPQFPELNGLPFTEIAEIRRQDPWDSYFDILSAAGENLANLDIVGDLFTDEHLAEMISNPLFSLGVDACSSTDSGPLSTVTTSPLSYSGHVHYLERHVRRDHTLTLEEAVHKLTSKPARRFGIRGRGLLREGYRADIVAFDFARIGSRSTFGNPAVYADGVELVVVNGAVTVDKGGHRGIRAGRVLRRAQGAA